MNIRVLTLLVLLGFVLPAQAMAQDCGKDTSLAGLTRCAGVAVDMLPQAKRARLDAEIAALEAQIAGEVRPANTQLAYPDYGWEAARLLVSSGGVDRLIMTARQKSGALRYGRAEALHAAGSRAAGFHQDDEAAQRLAMTSGAAEKLNDELLSLARSAEAFERGDLAHAAAMLAAERCDLSRFDAARAMTLAPDALRYKFWRARITGDRVGLPEAIMLAADSEDSGAARQAIDGITFLVEHGACGT